MTTEHPAPAVVHPDSLDRLHALLDQAVTSHRALNFGEARQLTAEALTLVLALRAGRVAA